MPTGIYKRTEEHKKKLSEANKGDKHYLYGKHLSEETKDKMRKVKRKTGEESHRFGKHLSEKAKNKLSEVAKKRIGEKGSNWKGGNIKIICKVCGKEKYVVPAIIKRGHGKFCSYSCNSIWNVKHQKTKDTSIEIAIEQELIKQSIPYLKQVPIEGIALVDFLLPNKIIIQCDGTYWHSKSKNKGRDIAQDTVLFFKGYKVFRFTETEIKKSAKQCIDKILEGG